MESHSILEFSSKCKKTENKYNILKKTENKNKRLKNFSILSQYKQKCIIKYRRTSKSCYTYFYWGYIRTGGLSLRWYRDNICDKEGDGEYYDLLSEKAKDVPAGSNGVLFLPYLTGGYGDFANASGAFLNMTMDTNQEVLWRAVLEAIGYDYISVTDVYRAGGVSLDKITVTEGGSRSDLWNQIKADMLNSTVTTLKKAGGAVMTNVVVAAYAVGDIDNLKDSFNSQLEVKKVYTPDPENTKYYRSIYNMQNKLVREDMKPTFDMLEKIREYK